MVHLVSKPSSRARAEFVSRGRVHDDVWVKAMSTVLKPGGGQVQKEVHAAAVAAAQFAAKARPRWHEYGQLLAEVGYFCATAVMLVGCCYFFPGPTQNYRLGCRLFDVASIAVALLALVAMADMYGKPASPGRAREVAEQALYLLGSLLFMGGCLIFDPDLTPLFMQAFGGSHLYWELQSAKLFMVGSFLFAFAAFCNMLTIYYSPPMFPGAALTITTCYEFGGMLFAGGTMGFIPGLGCNEQMQTLGCWGYLAGAACYTFGSGLSLAKTYAMIKVGPPQSREADTVALLRERATAKRRCSWAADAVATGKGGQHAELWSRYAAREAEVACAMDRALRPEKTLLDVLLGSTEKAPLLG